MGEYCAFGFSTPQYKLLELVIQKEAVGMLKEGATNCKQMESKFTFHEANLWILNSLKILDIPLSRILVILKKKKKGTGAISQFLYYKSNTPMIILL